METTLQGFLEYEHPIAYFLFVLDGEAWLPHYLVHEWPGGWFMLGWEREANCRWVSDQLYNQ